MAAASPELNAAPRRPRRKGPRPKHVPQRMCVTCRQHDAKRGLFRIVRAPTGEVALDPTGRQNGRGAYLCHQPACWEKALTSGQLSRALNVDLDADAMAELRRHAATLPAESAAANEGGTA